MTTSSRNVVSLVFFAFAILSAPKAGAEKACPSDVAKPFLGEWNGQALFVPAQGAQQSSTTRDKFAIVDCQSFELTIHYLDSAGKVVRVLSLKASADKSGEPGLFAVKGSATDGTIVNPMNGSFKRVQDGTLLGIFLGAIGGKPAYLTELMNLSTLANGRAHLTRTVQMFAEKRGGNYLGSRIVQEEPIQAPK